MAQTGERELRTIHEGTVFGFGDYQLKDSYLSPFIYKGWGGSILNERTTMLKPEFSRRQIIGVDISTTKNPTQNINDFGTFVDYSLGYYYHVLNGRLNILVGPASHIMGGFIYNTYNGNNPISAKADVDVNLSFVAVYTLNVKNRPVVFNCQGMIPLVGAFFAPAFGASYYEMFNENNMTDIIAINSFHNKLAFMAYMTVDIPVSSLALRLSYVLRYYATDVKDIQSRILSNSFMIGWVKEFYVK
jgi:hypothetical protein